MKRPPRSLRSLLLFVAGLALAPAVARAQASSAIRVTVVDAQSDRKSVV